MIKALIFHLVVAGLIQYGSADAEPEISLPSFDELMLLARGSARDDQYGLASGSTRDPSGALPREQKSFLSAHPFNDLREHQRERPPLHFAVARHQQGEPQHFGRAQIGAGFSTSSGVGIGSGLSTGAGFSTNAGVGIGTGLSTGAGFSTNAGVGIGSGLSTGSGFSLSAHQPHPAPQTQHFSQSGVQTLLQQAAATPAHAQQRGAGQNEIEYHYVDNTGLSAGSGQLTYSASPASASLLQPSTAQSNALFGGFGVRLGGLHSESGFPSIQVPAVARGSRGPVPARQPAQPVPIFTGFETDHTPNILVEPALTYDLVNGFNPNRARQPAVGRDPGPVLEVVAEAQPKCVDKVEHVEETEFDYVEKCDHSYDKKCHTSYSTEYTSQQETECDDSYQKDCDITYSPSARNTTVEVCSRPLVKNCDIPGPVECRTEYVSECWTKHEEHSVVDDVAECETVYDEKCHEVQSGYSTKEKCSKWPREVCNVNKKLNKKVTPEVKCEKVPQELCGPAGCGFVPGPEVCHEKTVTVVQDLPTESCNLQPSTKCEHVTKLVPKLVPKEECVDVPKEVCQKVRGPPKTVVKAVTKKWCYTPSVESGLH